MGKRSVARAALIGLLAVLVGPAWSDACRAADSAVVLLYHRFDDNRVPALNTDSDLLAAHLAELKRNGHTVMALPQVIDSMRTGKPLPDKAVAITIDDASASIHSRAWPVLKKAGLPVTLSIATDEIDRGGPDTLTWNQIREMVAQGANVASQGAARLRMSRTDGATVTADLVRAHARFERELGMTPTVFTWPWGETGAEAKAEVRRAGYHAAFGQHSGAAWAMADAFYLPRFGVTGPYGDLERFRLAARALPLPAVDVTPADPALKANPPAFGFTLTEEVPGIDGLTCFASHQGQLRVERLGPRIEVRMSKPFPPGRGRLNCTVATLEGRWRWFGWQFVAP